MIFNYCYLWFYDIAARNWSDANSFFVVMVLRQRHTYLVGWWYLGVAMVLRYRIPELVWLYFSFFVLILQQLHIYIFINSAARCCRIATKDQKWHPINSARRCRRTMTAIEYYYQIIGPHVAGWRESGKSNRIGSALRLTEIRDTCFTHQLLWIQPSALHAAAKGSAMWKHVKPQAGIDLGTHSSSGAGRWYRW